jgi:hypothetical protein
LVDGAIPKEFGLAQNYPIPSILRRLSNSASQRKLVSG